MNKDFIFRVTSILIAVFALISCDDDFNSVGSEVIGGVGFEEDTYISTPIAYNKKLERVQTSGLSGNLLGFYDDPVYGVSEYSVLTQMIPATENPTFGKNPVLDSVVLTLPYFNTDVSTELEEGITKRTYELDSVYGNTRVNLKLYQSDFFLREFDLDSDFEERQIYYSNDISGFNQMSVQAVPIDTIMSFLPSEDEVVLPIRDVNGLKSEVDKEKDSILEVQRLSPRLRFKLPNDLFKSLIIDKEGDPALSNANNFKNYFRGLFIQPELINGLENGNLFAFNMLSNDANITMFYSSETDNKDENDVDNDGNKDELLREQKTYVLNFSSPGPNNTRVPLITINEIKNSFDINIPDPDTDKGDESLYLKGGEGSYAVLELFSRYVETDDNGEYIFDENGNPLYKVTPANLTENDKTELDFLRDQNWLVNNASLKLYIDREKMTVGGSTEPERIYIFNLESGEVLADFCQDPTASFISDPNNAVTIHLGRLNRGSDGIGEFYQINLTRHIINLLNNNIDITKLGIAVSQNVTIEGQVVNNNCVSSPSLSANDDDIVPISSVLSPEGTIIYGNTDNVAPEKRLQLEIKYSKSIRN